MKTNINEQFYAVEIKKMTEIVGDRKGVNEFTLAMYDALVQGRRISEKMLKHIHKIIKINDLEVRIKRGEWVKEITTKLNKVNEMVEKTSWTDNYKQLKKYFINSLISQSKERLTLTEKQLAAVNKIYKQTKKRLEKEKK